MNTFWKTPSVEARIFLSKLSRLEGPFEPAGEILNEVKDLALAVIAAITALKLSNFQICRILGFKIQNSVNPAILHPFISV